MSSLSPFHYVGLKSGLKVVPIRARKNTVFSKKPVLKRPNDISVTGLNVSISELPEK